MYIPYKKILVGATFFGASLSFIGCEPTTKGSGSIPDDKPEELTDKVSYIVGFQTADNLKQSGVTLNDQRVMQGIKDALAGDSSLFNPQELQMVMQEMQTLMTQFQQQKADSMKQIGEDWLAENANKEGVKVTPTGLQYEVIEEGSGPSPDSSSMVTVHYHGTTIDGEVFDSSIDRGQPATFPVSGVISGWTEALLMMKEGAKWKLYIPSELAYGERGQGNRIEPNSVLVFDVELLEVNEQAPNPAEGVQ